MKTHLSAPKDFRIRYMIKLVVCAPSCPFIRFLGLAHIKIISFHRFCGFRRAALGEIASYLSKIIPYLDCADFVKFSIFVLFWLSPNIHMYIYIYIFMSL